MYLSLSEFVSAVPALEYTDSDALAGIVGQIINDASRQFDTLTKAPTGYYAEKPTKDSADKTYYSNGTNFVHTHRFHELVDVKIDDESVLDRLIIRDQQRLEIGYLIGRLNAPVIVTAHWGFEEIPDDVKQAVKMKAHLTMTVTPMSRAGIDEIQISEAYEAHMKSVWDNVVDKYARLNRFAYV